MPALRPRILRTRRMIAPSVLAAASRAVCMMEARPSAPCAVQAATPTTAPAGVVTSRRLDSQPSDMPTATSTFGPHSAQACGNARVEQEWRSCRASERSTREPTPGRRGAPRPSCPHRQKVESKVPRFVTCASSVSTRHVLSVYSFDRSIFSQQLPYPPHPLTRRQRCGLCSAVTGVR